MERKKEGGCATNSKVDKKRNKTSEIEGLIGSSDVELSLII